MSVKENDWIVVEYDGLLDDGTMFDSSKGRDPLKFKVGIGMVIPGFEDGVIGMKSGEEKDIKVTPEEGYGPKNTEVAKIPKELLNSISDLQEGKEIVVMSGMGPLAIEIVKIDETTIDAILNHPLAGKNLTFKVKLIEVLSEAEAAKMDEELEAHSCGGSCSSCHGECGEDDHECEDDECDCEDCDDDEDEEEKK
ncbi:MAG: FKBP-type peptidyl-prolyl cis-trans isomerase [archaeon]|jgi:peptidylprolyl isomerase